MSKHKWFFKRGNARLSWETLPEWTEFVAVDMKGRIFAYNSKPTCGSGHWLESGNLFDEVAYTGCICEDWQTLIFERPRALSAKDCEVSIELNKLTLPTITTEEWTAIRMLLPEAEYVMKESNSEAWACVCKPIKPTFGESWIVANPFDAIRVPALSDRFASVPWRDSLVKYEPPQENFSIKVTCACGEEVLVDNEPIYGVWAKRSYVIPCPNCHAHLKIRVKYEAAD